MGREGRKQGLSQKYIHDVQYGGSGEHPTLPDHQGDPQTLWLKNFHQIRHTLSMLYLPIKNCRLPFWIHCPLKDSCLMVWDHPVTHKLQDQDEQPGVQREHSHLLPQCIHVDISSALFSSTTSPIPCCNNPQTVLATSQISQTQ